jgi:hypothetical protein
MDFQVCKPRSERKNTQVRPWIQLWTYTFGASRDIEAIPSSIGDLLAGVASIELAFEEKSPSLGNACKYNKIV